MPKKGSKTFAPNEELTEAISYSFSPSALLSRLRSVPHAVVPVLVADHILGFLGTRHLRIVAGLEEDMALSVRKFFWDSDMGPIDEVVKIIPNVTHLTAPDFGAETFDDDDADNQEEEEEEEAEEEEEEEEDEEEEEEDDSRVVAALAVISNVTTLDFTDGQTIGGKTCAAAAALPRLTTLDLRRCSNVDNVALKEFSKPNTFPVLSRLVLVHINASITVKHATTLAALPALTELDLDGRDVDTGAAKALSKSATLQRLDVAYSNRLVDDGLRALANLRTLKHIRLSGAGKVTDDGVVALVTGCVRLRSLVIADMEQLTDKSMLAISQSLPDLEVLTMPSGTVSVDSLQTFEHLPKLMELDFGFQTRLAGGLPTLCAAAPNLTTLHWPREDDMRASDFGALKHLKSLTTVSVNITFTPEHFAVIGAHPTLKNIWARYCHGLTAEGLAELRPNTQLRLLHVSHADIDDEGVAVVEAMPNVKEFRCHSCSRVPELVKRAAW